ncbi:class I SAM-dependent methyltransferase [Aquisphaera insulae]|uniref:class I SAM-dependent methyltransferase n=1 Tax=Aquisphaera insulae TaxID=2712864 RepID=UPI00202F7C89|nr:class I SAM-dependent methyltransferase [Aquisphaera insulae]
MGRLPMPGPIKRVLVPIWNEAHRLGWLVREQSAAILSGSTSLCSVCGKVRPMIYRRRVVPEKLVERWGLTPELAAALARKESSDCAGCGAKLRARRLASVILETFPVGSPPAPARSLAGWVKSPEAARLRVAEINRIDGIHEVLRALPNFASSDYHPGALPGEIVEGTRSEDLTRLTYRDESFDLVLTSESLEHVPDLDAALGEIRRVLVPGGRHIFTIPVLPDEPRTFSRAELRPDGSIKHLAASIHHPGGDVGYLVFTEFGADLPEILRAAGFELTVHFGPVRDDDLAQVYGCERIDS